MPKSILQLRMEGLAKNLQGAQDPDNWLGRLDLQNKPDSPHWQKAVEAMGKEAEELLVDLREAIEDTNMSAQDGWALYFATQTKSEEIFRESLALLGGLALRDRINDEFVCRFADELIGECAEFVGMPTSFAIPAFEDTLSSTLRRVARIGFPDWHLWTLPLVAHEYGQVIIRETTSLNRLIDDLAAEHIAPAVKQYLDLVRNSPRLSTPGTLNEQSLIQTIAQPNSDVEKLVHSLENVAEMALRSNETDTAALASTAAVSIRKEFDDTKARVQILVADVFATFICGPAYACATLILRLNPASPPLPGRPSDSERADLILQVLREMDDAVVPPPLSSVISRLTTSWNLLTTGVGVPSNLNGSSKPVDAGLILTRIRARMLRQQAEFTAMNWSDAEMEGNKWWHSLNAHTELTCPASIDKIRLRDILNSAWQCRLMIMEQGKPLDIDKNCESLIAIARTCCDRISDRQAASGRSSAFGGRAQRP